MRSAKFHMSLFLRAEEDYGRKDHRLSEPRQSNNKRAGGKTQASSFEAGSEIVKYFEMLPENSMLPESLYDHAIIQE